jgi:putative inorganic carbon (HCO3(-)) transporter
VDDGLPDMLPLTVGKQRAQSDAVARRLPDARILAVAEPLLLVAALPFLVALPLWLAPLGVGLVAASWLVRWSATGRLSVRSPVDWPLALLVVMMPIALWTTAMPEVTWRALAQLVAGLATLIGVLNWAGNESRVRVALWGLIFVGVGLALIAPVSVHWQVAGVPVLIPRGVYRAMPRLLSDQINANVMAGALALILPIPAALLLLGSQNAAVGVPGLERHPRLARWLLVFAWLLMAGVLALTKSRGAYLATGLGMLLVIVLWRRWLLVGLPLAAVLGVLAWLQLGGHSLADTLLGGQAIAGQAVGGWVRRSEIWSRALSMIQDFPFTGIGMGSFNETANLMYPFFQDGPAVPVPHAHNLFLQVGVDLGIPGLVAYVALWLICLGCAWRAYATAHRQGQVGLAAVAAGLGVSLVVMALHGLLDAVTWGTKPAVVAWAVMGMCIALHRVVRSGA